MASSSRIIKLGTLGDLGRPPFSEDADPMFRDDVTGAYLSPDARRTAVLEEAAAEADAIRAQAREEGYQEGLSQVQAETGVALERVRALAEAAIADRAQWARASEREVAGLALLIAERVVGRHLSEHRDVVVSVVQQGLETLDDLTGVRIRVHPDDVAVLQAAWTQIAAGAELADALTPDERVHPGGCLIEAGESRIDVQQHSVLQAIDRAFRDYWGDWV